MSFLSIWPNSLHFSIGNIVLGLHHVVGNESRHAGVYYNYIKNLCRNILVIKMRKHILNVFDCYSNYFPTNFRKKSFSLTQQAHHVHYLSSAIFFTDM